MGTEDFGCAARSSAVHLGADALVALLVHGPSGWHLQRAPRSFVVRRMSRHGPGWAHSLRSPGTPTRNAQPIARVACRARVDPPLRELGRIAAICNGATDIKAQSAKAHTEAYTARPPPLLLHPPPSQSPGPLQVDSPGRFSFCISATRRSHSHSCTDCTVIRGALPVHFTALPCPALCSAVLKRASPRSLLRRCSLGSDPPRLGPRHRQ